MDFVVEMHSGFRWLVLAALIVAVVISVLRTVRSEPWWAPPYSIAIITLDIQVTIGIVLWFGTTAWSGSGVFFGVIHPLVMLGALAVAHVMMRRARSDGTSRANGLAGIGLVVALGLILAALPR